MRGSSSCTRTHCDWKLQRNDQNISFDIKIYHLILKYIIRYQGISFDIKIHTI